MGKRRQPLDTEQKLIRIRRDTLATGNGLDQSELKLGQRKDVDTRDETKNKENRSRKPKNFNIRRRCFLGSPYGCSPPFADPLLDWPSPWGWTPGPLYPEYGPDFHSGWAGHGRPFSYNRCGCGGSWGGPSSSCGCNNHGWCCKSFVPLSIFNFRHCFRTCSLKLKEKFSETCAYLFNIYIIFPLPVNRGSFPS